MEHSFNCANSVAYNECALALLRLHYGKKAAGHTLRRIKC